MLSWSAKWITASLFSPAFPEICRIVCSRCRLLNAAARLLCSPRKSEVRTQHKRRCFGNSTATLCGQFICRRRYSNNSTSRVWLKKAVKLTKVASNKSLSTMSLIEIELSKAYLYRALRCKDSDSDSIYCLANVYLSVLYYTTGQYQTAIDHCTLVTRSLTVQFTCCTR